jgi:dTDP-glucose 4,6-dehydratase
MTKVLLTGIGGFIGSHTLEHLLVNTDWNIVGIASWKHKGCPERIQEIVSMYKDRVEVITHDLESPISPQTAKRIGEVDYILNIASESHVDRSITDPVPFVENNVKLVLNMLEFARTLKSLKSFIQISTDEVYGAAPDGVNHKEWSEILPSNPYSASKAAQEAIVISYWRTYGLPIVITNTMNNFGERQDSEKYVSKVINAVIKGDTVTVHGRPGYIGSRYYLHARNHADALLYILKNLPPTPYQEGVVDRPDRYNVVGEKEITNLEMAEMVAKMLNKELKYTLVDFHGTRPGHDRRYALDGSKLKNLGWKPPFSIEESMKKTIDWTLKNPLWL